MIGFLQPIHMVEAVKDLHWRNSTDIYKLLKSNKDFTICYRDGEKEDLSQMINVEKMVRLLPLHLIAVLISSEEDDKFQYVLCGIRLLNTFCDLSFRHSKLEQALFDDVKVSAQVLDLVILMVVTFAGNRKECSDNESLLDATLLASSLYLMHGFISPKYEHLVKVLLVHSRVEIFIDCVFGAVHNVVRSLKAKLMFRRTDLPKKLGSGSVNEVNIHCQQAEATLQFLHSLCQDKLFRDRIAKNKELCRNGGVLMLAQSVLSLAVTPEFITATGTIASISRMKAKVLSILQNLFEAESVSFLDDVVNAGNLHLAKAIVSEVLNLLRLGLSKATKFRAPPPEYPMGFVLLNAMRLADVLTDDSNFRSFFAEHLSIVLSSIFCLSHGDFVSMLCASNISSREDDANVDYDLFMSAGRALSAFSSLGQSSAPIFKLNLFNNLTMASYAHQRSSFVIKMIANLHCFDSNLCKEEDRNRFIRNFMIGLRMDPLKILVNMLPWTSYTPLEQRGTGVLKNLCSLLRHGESLIPNSVSGEDVVLLRVFCDQLEPLIRSEFEECQVNMKDILGAGWNYFGKQKRKEMEIVDNAERGNNVETSGSDTSCNKEKSLVEDEERKEDEKTGSLIVFEKQTKRRKRSIMSDDQMGMIEKALGDEPDMQRNSTSIQLWADKLSQTGSEVITSSQLKNWLNNRKAKLARANKQTGSSVHDNTSSGDLPETPGDENTCLQKPSKTPKTGETSSSSSWVKQGQQVKLMNENGEEIGKGKVLKTEGDWFGLSLETRQVCVVDVMEITGSYDWSKMIIPYGSDDNVGRSFGDANSGFGLIRVAWDVNKLQHCI